MRNILSSKCSNTWMQLFFLNLLIIFKTNKETIFKMVRWWNYACSFVGQFIGLECFAFVKQ